MIDINVRDLCSAYPPVLPFFGNIRKFKKHPFQDQSFQTYPVRICFYFKSWFPTLNPFAGKVVVSDPSFSDIVFFRPNDWNSTPSGRVPFLASCSDQDEDSYQIVRKEASVSNQCIGLYMDVSSHANSRNPCGSRCHSTS